MTEREFEKYVNKYSRLLWTVAASVLEGIGSEQDTEECVADVFIELWQKPESFDPSRGSLKNFLCMKCRSRAIDRFRRLSAHMSEELSEEMLTSLIYDDSMQAEPSELRERQLEALRTAMESLGEPEREIMVRRFCLEQKPSAIASTMKLDLRKVENLIYRTKAKLRAQVEDTLRQDCASEPEGSGKGISAFDGDDRNKANGAACSEKRSSESSAPDEGRRTL